MNNSSIYYTTKVVNMSSEDSSRSGGTRAYRSSLREEQARDTRRRILQSASEVFARKGYSGTSLSDIATGAGVSVESVKLHGPKRQLLLAAFEVAFAGAEGQSSLSEGPDMQRVMAIEPVEDFLAAVVGYIADANARTSGLWAAFVAAAASDDVVKSVFDALLARRKRDYRSLVALVQERGLLVAELAQTELHRRADVLSFLMSPEGHAQLVTQAGWSFTRYRDWLIDAVHGALTA